MDKKFSVYFNIFFSLAMYYVILYVTTLRNSKYLEYLIIMPLVAAFLYWMIKKGYLQEAIYNNLKRCHEMINGKRLEAEIGLTDKDNVKKEDAIKEQKIVTQKTNLDSVRLPHIPTNIVIHRPSTKSERDELPFKLEISNAVSLGFNLAFGSFLFGLVVVLIIFIIFGGLFSGIIQSMFSSSNLITGHTIADQISDDRVCKNYCTQFTDSVESAIVYHNQEEYSCLCFDINRKIIQDYSIT